MTDLFDDDLFAPRPASKSQEHHARKVWDERERQFPPFVRQTFDQATELARAIVLHPVASFACPCGGIDEVREPAPIAVDCWKCREAGGMRRYVPARLPPATGGRPLTDAEARGMNIGSALPAPR